MENACFSFHVLIYLENSTEEVIQNKCVRSRYGRQEQVAPCLGKHAALGWKRLVWLELPNNFPCFPINIIDLLTAYVAQTYPMCAMVLIQPRLLAMYGLAEDQVAAQQLSTELPRYSTSANLVRW